MPKYGQLRIGAAWYGEKEPDLLAPGRLRYYDKRCRTRIIIGAQVRAHIAKNSIWRYERIHCKYPSPHTKMSQQHFKYYKNIGAPGSTLAKWQAIFKQVMQEVKLLPENIRNHYRTMEKEYFDRYRHHPGMYRARSWPHFYVQERLKELYPRYP